MSNFNWLPFVFLRLTPALVLGILTGIYGGEYILHPVIFLTSLGAAYFLLSLFLKNSAYQKWNPLLGILALTAMFFVGFIRVTVFDQANSNKNIIHLKDTIEYYQAINISETSATDKFLKNTVRISKIKVNEVWSIASGKVLFYQKKDGSEKTLKYGDLLLVKGCPNVVNAPLNPNEFDYKRYLGFKNIFHQDFTTGNNVKVYQSSPPNHLIGFSIKMRERLTSIITKKITGVDERAIALALVLGVKDDLDSELKQAYSAAGAIHVLAVSGLHVGIIYLVLSFAFGWLRNRKYGRIIFILTMLSVMWSYALITGFSSSVLRAVTMFSFLLIGNSFYKKTNVYNNLAISAFILLLFNPFYIVSVGFQLSYIAVLGILYLHPKIYNWLSFDSLILDKIWAIMSVSLSAQIATFPLTIMYFHQFPTYFFVSNLVVIPAAFLILFLGFLTLFSSPIPVISNTFAFLLENIIGMVNKIVFLIESIPYSTVSGISMDKFQVVLIYLIIIYFLAVFANKKLSQLKISFALLVMFTASRIYQLNIQSQQQKIIFYNVQGANVIDLIKGFQHRMIVDSKSDNITNKFDYHIKPNWVKMGLINKENPYTINQDSSTYLLSWQEKNILIINNPVNHLNGVLDTADIVVINHNAINNIGELESENTILPSTNHKWYLKKWEEDSSVNKNINYHIISKKGALILDL